MKDNYERGVELRRTLMGDETVGDLTAVSAQFGMRRFGEFVYDAILGNLWLRPGLDLKTRSLICIVVDVALGIQEELALHIRIAHRQGWSREEIVEAIIHTGGYAGTPRARGAMIVADRVFGEIEKPESVRPGDDGAG